MATTYELNCAQYVMLRDGRPVTAPMDEIAICFDRECGTLHKHGVPESVRKWHTASTEKLRSGGADDLADLLVVIQGRFTLEDIDKVLSITGYAQVLYKSIQDGTAAALDIHGAVVQPT